MSSRRRRHSSDLTQAEKAELRDPMVIMGKLAGTLAKRTRAYAYLTPFYRNDDGSVPTEAQATRRFGEWVDNGFGSDTMRSLAAEQRAYVERCEKIRRQPRTQPKAQPGGLDIMTPDTFHFRGDSEPRDNVLLGLLTKKESMIDLIQQHAKLAVPVSLLQWMEESEGNQLGVRIYGERVPAFLPLGLDYDLRLGNSGYPSVTNLRKGLLNNRPSWDAEASPDVLEAMVWGLQVLERQHRAAVACAYLLIMAQDFGSFNGMCVTLKGLEQALRNMGVPEDFLDAALVPKKLGKPKDGSIRYRHLPRWLELWERAVLPVLTMLGAAHASSNSYEFGRESLHVTLITPKNLPGPNIPISTLGALPYPARLAPFTHSPTYTSYTSALYNSL